MNSFAMKTSGLIFALVALANGQDSQENKRISNTKGCSGFYKPGVDPKSAGSKYNDCVIDVPEGDHTSKAYFKLDEPIYCSESTVECAVIVTITSSNEDHITVDPCQIKWTPNQWRETRFVEISGKVDYSNNLADLKVHLNTSVITSAPYYQKAEVDDIYFVSENLRVATCSANGDPHYRTFDGRVWHFYNRNPGAKQNRVTLARSTQESHDYIVQNQIRGYPARNCAIAAREGRNLVIIDACSGRVQTKAEFHTPYKSHEPVIEVSGSTYTVYFRSGAWIRARASGAYVGITIEGVDYGHSCGICGNFNGDPWDDAVAMTDANGATVHRGCGGGFNSDGKCVQPRIDPYSALDACMKVPSVKTIRYPTRNGTLGMLHDGGDLWDWEYNGRWCNETVKTDCFPDEVAPPPADTSCNASLGVIRPVIDTRPGSVEDVTDDLLQLNEEIHNRCDGRDVCNGWAFEGGNGNTSAVTPYPEDKSLDKCKQFINEELDRVLTCVIYFGTDGNSLNGDEGSMIEALKKNASAQDLHTSTFDYNEYITDCADDYSALGGPMRTDDLSEQLLNATVRRMDRDCLDFCISTDCKEYAPQLRANLTSALCEESCSGHGVCGDMGVCTCEEGFGASDCSIDLNSPPTVSQISELAFDLTGHSEDNIGEVRIYGSNFQKNTTHAQCRYGDPADATYGKYAQVVTAHWIGPTTVICPMPAWDESSYVNASNFDKNYRHTGVDPMKMKLQITNDGETWSTNNVIFEFYDGVCSVCSHSNGQCNQNPKSCVIKQPDGSSKCYAEYTGKDNNPCEECRVNLGVVDSLTFDSNLNLQACSPVFAKRDYEFILHGANVKDSFVGSVNGTSNTLMQKFGNYIVTYEYIKTITDFNFEIFYQVNSNTGEITVAQDVDPTTLCMDLAHACDNPLVYHSGFQVKATDNFGVSTMISVDVPLLPDKSTEDPYKDFPDGFSGTIPENSKPGTAVLDADGQPLKIPFDLDRDFFTVAFKWYREEAGNALHIDNTTGLVTVAVNGLLDHETNPVLSQVVAAEELSSENKFENFFIIAVTVNVTDVNEPPTALLNKTSGEALRLVLVPESPTTLEEYFQVDPASPTSLIGCTNACGELVELAATDPEGGVLTFAITNQTAYDIEVVSANPGKHPPFLRANQGFNFEDNRPNRPNSFTLMVQVTDTSGLFTTFPVDFVITDVNEGVKSIDFKNLDASSDIVDQGAVSLTIDRGLVGRSNGAASYLAEIEVTDIDGDTPMSCYVVSEYFKVVKEDNGKMFLERRSFSCFDHQQKSLKLLCDDSLANKPTQRSGSVEYTIEAGANDIKPKLISYNDIVATTEEATFDDRTKIGTVVFSDVDAQSGSFSFEVDNPGLFDVVPAGACSNVEVTTTVFVRRCSADIYIKAGAVLSYEDYLDTNGKINLGVTATNSESLDAVESCIDGIEISLTLTDVIELPTGFETVPLELTIEENADDGTVVGSFSFVDDDVSSTYTSVTTPADGAFIISEVQDRRRDGTRRWNIILADSTQVDFSAGDSINVLIDLTENTVSKQYLIPVNVADVRPMIVQTGDLQVPSNVAPCATDVVFTVKNVDITPWLDALTWKIDGELAAYASLVQVGEDKTTVKLQMDSVPPAFTSSLTLKVTADFGALTSVFKDGIDAVTTFQFYSLETVEVRIAPNVTVSDLSPNPIPYLGAAGSAEEDLVTVAATDGDQADQMFVYVVEYPSTAATDTTKTMYYDPACTQNNRYSFTPSVGAVPLVFKTLDDKFSGCTSVSMVDNKWTCAIKVAVTAADAGTTIDGGSLGTDGVISQDGLFVLTSFQRGGVGVASLTPMTVSFVGEPTTTTEETFIIIVDESTGAGTNNTVGTAVGVVMGLILLILLVIAVVFYRRQQSNKRKNLFADNKGPSYESNPAYEEGLYSESSTDFRVGVENPVYSWYQPKMTRKECSDYLGPLGEGAFVVRDSEANPGWHMLGVKNQNDVVHEKIRLTVNQTYQLIVTGGATDQPEIKTIPELINHYATQQGDMPYTLVDCDPIYDNSRLVQERTGAVQGRNDNGLNLPQKNTEYAELPVGQTIDGANQGDDSVGNPMYFANNPAETTYSEADGYLDIKPDAAKNTQAYLDVNPDLVAQL